MRRVGWTLMAGLLATGALTDCARQVDDPDNPPRLGHWRDETRAIGMTLDDRSVPLEDVPPGLHAQLAQATRTEELCGEPRLRNRDEATRLIAARLPDCSVEEWTLEGHSVSGLARCAPRAWGATAVTPTVRVEGAMGATYIRLDIQSIARIPEPSGNTHSAVFRLRRTIERTGDC